MRFAVVFTIAALGSFLLTAGTAPAQVGGTDPSAGSPSGTLYELPVDGGRGDAAPAPPGSGQGGPPTSSYRSENNFGASTRVPGTKSGADGEAASAVAVRPVSNLGNTSAGLNVALLALITAIGGMLGVAATRGRRDATG